MGVGRIRAERTTDAEEIKRLIRNQVDEVRRLAYDNDDYEAATVGERRIFKNFAELVQAGNYTVAEFQDMAEIVLRLSHFTFRRMN